MTNMHLIHKGDNYFVYLPSSYDIIKVNKLTYVILQLHISGIPYDSICKAYDIAPYEIDKMVRYFESLSHNSCQSISLGSFSNDDHVIDRITLHVSNDCNLRCRYCYASGGHYKKDRVLMSKETAKCFVEFCIRQFKEVRNIVFFGGEPFLNPSVILYICQTFENKYKNKEIDYMPKFGAITNGTIISRQIKEIVERYFDFLTISIDGPKEINDENRVDTNGVGSFDRICNFIEQMRNIPHLKIRYESTFTDKHIGQGYTHKSIRQFMRETFKLSGDILDEYHMEKCATKDTASEYTADEILNHNYPEGFMSILRALVNKKPKMMCQLYRRILSVSAEGHIYPCHMNTGTDNCYMGNMASDNVYVKPNTYLQQHPGIMYGFKNNDICSRCWANNLCGGCSRIWFYDETSSCYSLYPNSDICEKNCKHIENILLVIGILKADASKWKIFMRGLKDN